MVFQHSSFVLSVHFVQETPKPLKNCKLPKKGKLVETKFVKLGSFGTIRPALKNSTPLRKSSIAPSVLGCFGATTKACQKYLSVRNSGDGVSV